MEKSFTLKEVCVLIFITIVVISFLETNAGISFSSWEFWKEFILKIFIYIGVATFVGVFIETTKS